MQPAEAAFYNVLDVGLIPGPGPRVRDLSWLIEFYEYDTPPGPDGFDPADAVQRFARIEYNWLGYAYRRVVLSAPDITKAKGSQAGRFTLRLSNADENRYAATWINSAQVEGMRMVVRIISRSASTTLAASNQRFSGRCDKPEGFDVIQGSISATEDVGGDDVEWPPRVYSADDPEGRSPSDPLYEGFPFITVTGSFSYVLPEQDRRYARNDPRRYVGTLPYSPYDDTPLGDPIQMILGRSQIRMNRGLYVDRGRVTDCLDFACMGPIEGFLNFRMPIPAGIIGTVPENVTYHLGEAGGTGTQTHDPLWPNHPYFSYTAYIGYQFRAHGGAAETTIDAGQPTVTTVLGLVCPLPDGAGVYNQTGWSDDGADQTYLLLTGSRFFNHPAAFLEDSSFVATRRYNQEPLVDQSNSGQIFIPSPDFLAAGDSFQRFRSTAYVSAARARYELGLSVESPESLAVPGGDFEPFNPDDPPLVPVDVTRLLKRFTTNVILKKRVKAKKFLFETLFPSFRAFLVMNYRGRWDLRSDRPADFAHLRSAVSAGATTIPVEDATPWKATNGLWGQILLGTPLTTSEVRKVTAAAYTSDANGIAFSASKSGSVTVSASGAALAGGNSTTQATGTVTIGGSPAAGDTVTVTVEGIPVTYTVESSETPATVAYMVAAHLNANTQLRRFVTASASGAVVTLSSMWGILTLSSALANGHGGPASNPASAPSISAGGSGSSLSAGTYRVAYANRNANGSTYVSPYSSVVVSAGQNIVVAALALPAGVTSRDWFVSKGPGDPEMVLYANADGSGFNVTAPPSSTATFPPEYNTTGEQLVRVALPFASNNQTAAILAQANLTRGNIFTESYKYPGGRDQSSYTETAGTYVSAKDDYAESKVIVVDDAKRARLGKRSPKELDLTAVDNYHQARRLVYYDSAKFIDRHWFNTLKSNGLALLLEEGDVICASDDSGGHVNVLTQVEEFTIHLSDFTVTINRARLYSTDMFRELVPRTQPLLPSVLKWVTTLDTEIQILDIPYFRELDAAKGPGLPIAIRRASGSGDWTGATIWLNTGGGYRQALEWDVEAVTGEALTTLADHAPGLDTTSTVRVRLDNPADTLATVTDDEFRAGANLFRVQGEILQARDVAPVVGTDDEYDLSHLHRGLLGTEDGTGNHAVGDAFTVLDGAVAHLPIDVGYVGSEIGVKAVTVNQDLADATEHLFTWEGRALQPLSIARVELESETGLAPRDSAGTMLVQVWPRTRLGIVGDEYLIEYLTDDRSAVLFEKSFREGALLPALLVGVEGSKFPSGVTRSTLIRVATRDMQARSLQKIHAGGAFRNRAEATLRVTGSGNNQVSFGLVSAAAYTHALTNDEIDYRFTLSALTGTLKAYEGATEIYSETSTAYASAGKRVWIELMDGRVYFYVDRGDSSPYAAVSDVPANFPLVAFARLENFGSPAVDVAEVGDVVMTTDPLPTTMLTAEEQVRYYGGLKSAVQVRIRQHSGLRQVGYGVAWNGEI